MAEAAVERAPEQAQARDAQGKNGTSNAETAAKKRRALRIIGGVAGVVVLGVLVYLLLNAGKESTDGDAEGENEGRDDGAIEIHSSSRNSLGVETACTQRGWPRSFGGRMLLPT